MTIIKSPLFFLIAILTLSCATKNVDLKGRSVASYLESHKTQSLNAHQRLNLLVQNIDELKDSMNRSNPRYYLFENFLERVTDLITEIETYDGNSMEQNLWVPDDIKIAPKFHRIVTAYEVMSQAQDYLKLDPLVVGFDKNVNLNYETLDFILGQYKRRVEYFRANEHASVTVDAYEKIKSRETKELLQYLARRIEAYYENVLPRKNQQRRVERLVSWVQNNEKLSARTPERFKRTLWRLTRSYTYKRAMNSFTKVELPESGNIEGVTDSFNQVNSVQVCGEIMDAVAKNYLRNHK